MKLTGQHNQCRGCGEYFASNSAFDRHRIGKHGVRMPFPDARRCKTVDEMKSEGWTQQNGFWRQKGDPDWSLRRSKIMEKA